MGNLVVRTIGLYRIRSVLGEATGIYDSGRNRVIDPSIAVSKGVLCRRSFLRTTVATMAVTCIGDNAFGQPSPLVTMDAADQIRSCSVGIVDFASPVTDELSSPRVLDARAMRSGHGAFANSGVQLSFSGIQFPNSRMSNHISHLRVSLLMDVPGSDTGNISWNFWSYDKAEVLNVSSDLSTYVPLNKDGNLVFDVSLEKTDGTRRNYRSTLTAGRARTIPKLISGTYCMGVCDEKSNIFSSLVATHLDEVNQSASISVPHFVFKIDLPYQPNSEDVLTIV